MDGKTIAAIAIILLVVFTSVVTFFVIAGLSYLLCMGFGLHWSWWFAIGVWALVILVRMAMSAAKSEG